MAIQCESLLLPFCIQTFLMKNLSRSQCSDWLPFFSLNRCFLFKERISVRFPRYSCWILLFWSVCDDRRWLYAQCNHHMSNNTRCNSHSLIAGLVSINFSLFIHIASPYVHDLSNKSDDFAQNVVSKNPKWKLVSHSYHLD